MVAWPFLGTNQHLLGICVITDDVLETAVVACCVVGIAVGSPLEGIKRMAACHLFACGQRSTRADFQSAVAVYFLRIKIAPPVVQFRLKLFLGLFKLNLQCRI